MRTCVLHIRRICAKFSPCCDVRSHVGSDCTWQLIQPNNVDINNVRDGVVADATHCCTIASSAREIHTVDASICWPSVSTEHSNQMFDLEHDYDAGRSCGFADFSQRRYKRTNKKPMNTSI